MVLEVNKAAITINNIAVPGVYRNGLFIGETPVDAFLLFESGEIEEEQEKSIVIQYPLRIDSIFVLDKDCQDDSVYMFRIKPINQEIEWKFQFRNKNYTNLGNTNLIEFPRFVLEKGAIFTLSSSSTISAIAIFAKLAYTIEIKNF